MGTSTAPFCTIIPTVSVKLNLLCNWHIKTVIERCCAFTKLRKSQRKCGTKTELIYRRQEEPQFCKSLPGTQMETAACVLVAGY
jgi:hypothetical protein